MCWLLWNICGTNDHGYFPLSVITIQCFPYPWLITEFNKKTQRCHYRSKNRLPFRSKNWLPFWGNNWLPFWRKNWLPFWNKNWLPFWSKKRLLSGARTDYLSGAHSFTPSFKLVSSCCTFCSFLFFFFQLYCMFFDLRLLITFVGIVKLFLLPNTNYS